MRRPGVRLIATHWHLALIVIDKCLFLSHKTMLLVANQPVTARDEAYKGPVSPTAEPITPIPYGCTTLRFVASPIVN